MSIWGKQSITDLLASYPDEQYEILRHSTVEPNAACLKEIESLASTKARPENLIEVCLKYGISYASAWNVVRKKHLGCYLAA